MQSVLVVFFLLTSIAMVSLILLQHGKGADAAVAHCCPRSAAGSAGPGSANFLSRTTAVLAAAWFVIAMALGWYALQGADQPGLMEADPTQAAVPVKVVPPTDLPDIPEAKIEAVVSDVPDIPVAEASAVDATVEKAESATADPVGKVKEQSAE